MDTRTYMYIHIKANMHTYTNTRTHTRIRTCARTSTRTHTRNTLSNKKSLFYTNELIHIPLEVEPELLIAGMLVAFERVAAETLGEDCGDVGAERSDNRVPKKGEGC